jgi:two-component system, OmpR family, phosphate regulon response regulator PhoB
LSRVKILVVDDDPDILSLVRYNLEREGFSVLTAANGQDALQLVHSQPPQAIILDLMLPEVDGLEVFRQVKRDPTLSDIPVIMLTAKGEEVDRVVGFELGADDYITKPFSPRELILRLKAILKRSTPREEPIRKLSLKDLEIDFDRHQVWIGSQEINLTVIEFGLLSTLASRRGRVQTRDRLLADVWNYDSDVDSRTVDTHIRRLRSKLGRWGEAIETVRGLGYRFREQGP